MREGHGLLPLAVAELPAYASGSAAYAAYLLE